MSSSLASIAVVQTEFVTYMSFILLITGTIGNILNCLIFIRRPLRQNPCSRYFFATSIANMIALYFGGLTIVGLTMSTWFAVGACADRCASSSANVRIRSFSQIKVAQRVVGAIIIIVCLMWAQMFVCFNTNFQGVNCNPASQVCSSISDFTLVIFYSLLPPILMFIFGWITIRHVNNAPIHRTVATRRDRQLTILLVSQVLCVTILSLPVGIQKLYAEFTLSVIKSQERIQIETFFATLAVYIVLINSATSFYMFTLTSKLFRNELKSLLWLSRLQRVHVEPT